MKKIIFGLLAVVAIGFGAFAFMSGMFSKVEDEYGNTYKVWFDELTLVETVRTKEIVIPSEIDGKTVIAFGEDAFSGNIVLETLTIPATVTSIPHGSIRNTKELKSIEVDTNNKSYVSLNGILYDIEMTTLIKYPAQIRYAGYNPDPRLKTIAKCAFEDNKFIGTLNLHVDSKLEVIESQAFSGCSQLYAVLLPETMVSIGSSAFSNCNNLSNIELHNIKVIEEYTFVGCTKLKTLDISKVEVIKDHAFGRCANLEALTLESTVKTIEKNAFIDCPKLVVTVKGSEMQSGWVDFTEDVKEVKYS